MHSEWYLSFTMFALDVMKRVTIQDILNSGFLSQCEDSMRKKMLFCNRVNDTIPHFLKLRKSCDWMSVQERNWEWGQPMMCTLITSCERWTCVEWERSRIGFRMKNHEKRSNEYCDCAIILKIIHLYLWTSICAVKKDYSQCFFLWKGMWG